MGGIMVFARTVIAPSVDVHPQFSGASEVVTSSTAGDASVLRYWTSRDAPPPTLGAGSSPDIALQRAASQGGAVVYEHSESCRSLPIRSQNPGWRQNSLPRKFVGTAGCLSASYALGDGLERDALGDRLERERRAATSHGAGTGTLGILPNGVSLPSRLVDPHTSNARFD